MTDDGFWIEPPDDAPGTPDSAATDTAAVPTQRDHAPGTDADADAPESGSAAGVEAGSGSEGGPDEALDTGADTGSATATVPEARNQVGADPGTDGSAADAVATESAAAESAVEAAVDSVAESAVTESVAGEPEPEAAAEPARAPAPDKPDTSDETLLPALDPALLKPQLEAVLMVVENPVPDVVLASVLQQPTDAVLTALRELSEEYTAQGRGFDLRQVAGGWRFYTRPEHAEAVEKFVLDGQQSKLTQAALETLAVVAYRQPVSRSRISAVRGVNCDGVMRTLLARGLVEEYGTEPETGAYLYRTTDFFLERMGLVGLDELPELAPFLPEVEALEAETEGGLEGFPLRSSPTAAVGAGDDTGDDTGDEAGSDGDEAADPAEATDAADAAVEQASAPAPTDSTADEVSSPEAQPTPPEEPPMPSDASPDPSSDAASDAASGDAPPARPDPDRAPVASGSAETGDTGGEDPAAADAEDSADGAPADADDPVPATDHPTDTGPQTVPAETPGAAGETGQTTTDD